MAGKKDTGRMVADCREMPSEKNCSLTIVGTEAEVIAVAMRHAVEEHGHANSPALRDEIRKHLRPEREAAMRA
jgi:hypothetical protein